MPRNMDNTGLRLAHNDIQPSNGSNAASPPSSSTLPEPKRSADFIIRKVAFSQIPLITTIMLKAYANDDVQILLYPPSLVGSNESVVYNETLRWQRGQFFDPDYTTLVALGPSDLKDPHTEVKIVGFATWHRVRAPGEKRSCTADRQSTSSRIYSVFNRLELYVYDIANSISSYISPPPDVTNHAGYRAYREFIKRVESELLSKPELQSRWELGNVCVDPEYQGLGIGGSLVDWGCARADKEGVPCTLEASKVGARVYSKRGFVTVREEVVVDEKGYGGRAELNYMVRQPEPKERQYCCRRTSCSEGRKGSGLERRSSRIDVDAVAEAMQL